MGIKKYKPTTPSLRNMATLDGKEITKDAKPLKNMLQPKKSKAGRNGEGRITVRRRGGGVKKRYRLVDFKRSKTNIPAVVQAIVYDPNRSCNLAQVAYADGEKNYILAPLGLNIGDKVISSEKADIKVGNSKQLKDIPVGEVFHQHHCRLEGPGQNRFRKQKGQPEPRQYRGNDGSHLNEH